MSPLLVAWAPYDVKGMQLSHSHFIGWQDAEIWTELNISSWIRTHFKKKKETRFTAFYFLTTMAPTIAATVSQLYTRTRSAVSFLSD